MRLKKMTLTKRNGILAIAIEAARCCASVKLDRAIGAKQLYPLTIFRIS